MFFIALILTFFASFVFISGLLKKANGLILIICLVLSIYLSLGSTKTECRDGWSSPSIGIQGACAWHGGVTTKFTSFGKMLLLIDIGVIIFAVLISKGDDKNKSN